MRASLLCNDLLYLNNRRWTEQRSDDGAVFFHHRGSGRSSWEHPKDAYFKFL
jgi:hypothetical protein